MAATADGERLFLAPPTRGRCVRAASAAGEELMSDSLSVLPALKIKGFAEVGEVTEVGRGVGGAKAASNRTFSHLRAAQLKLDQGIQTESGGHLSAVHK